MAIKLTAAASALVVLQLGLHAAAHHGRNHGQHVVGAGPLRPHRPFDAPPSSPAAAADPYRFEYGVRDSRAHHAHGRYEESDGRGNSVKGSYSVAGPDGWTRVVEYTADSGRGFNAVVTNARGAAGRRGGTPAAAVAATSSSSSSPSASASAAAAAVGYHGPEFLQHSSRPSSYYKFYWLPSRDDLHE